MDEPGWVLVVPVKRLAQAKSRLRGTVTAHEELVLAMAVDTVRAALVCPAVRQVVVVTGDPAAQRALAALGARVVPEGPEQGLNRAITHGEASVAGSGAPVAALAADLPALRPAELARALRAAAAAPARAFVPDAAGIGTTLLTAPAGVALDPRFGPDSAAAHAGSGASRLEGPWPSLRRDVDTATDLTGALRLGLGTRTAPLAPGGASWPPRTRAGKHA